MTPSFIFFDVGANNGSTSVPLAKNSSDIVVYAFEPTPTLINKIKVE
jgi:FkbM family methyltransferase